APCRTIQYAVNTADPYSEIRVAAGTYTLNPNDNTCLNNTGVAAVVCVRDQELTILGGFSPNDWEAPDPVVNLTVIDGQNSHRGVLVTRWFEPTSLHLEGFTIQNGLARGFPNRTGHDQIFAYGGGIFIDMGGTPDWTNSFTLTHLIFKNNRAVGENTTLPAYEYGGSGLGGGLALRAVSNATLRYLTFEDNEARGGDGAVRGGYAMGGGVHTLFSTVTFSHLTLLNNVARGGNSSGSGRLSNKSRADAEGGGFATHGYDVTLEYVTATGNQAIGGNASEYGGQSFGGALFVEASVLRVYNANLRDNVSRGGTASAGAGGLAAGGAIDSHEGDLTIDRSYIIANLSQGGDGTTASGSPGGGGIYCAQLKESSAGKKIQINNSVIADNVVQFGAGDTSTVGGGAGGVWLQGTDAYLTHTSISNNRLIGSPLAGEAVLVTSYATPAPSTATIRYSIISDHTTRFVKAVHVVTGSSTTLDRILWANNNKDTNEGAGDAGTIYNLNPLYADSAGFCALGAPLYDYHICDGSPAINAAPGSGSGVDIDGEVRPFGGASDIGADELAILAMTLNLYHPESGTLRASWHPSSAVLAELDHYDITLSCAPGASSPNEVQCGQSLCLGQDTILTLTGLTDGKEYGITIEACDGEHQVIIGDNAQATPGDYHIITLPVAFRNH
ncbi:MAG: choice-of-anchor Q domain-containing protein, partial [Anaerolineae bacterium]